MTDILICHIERYITLDEESKNLIIQSFSTFNLLKKELILTEGDLCHYTYFVAEGCLRLYYVDNKGSEQTIQFALENWWMTDIEAFNHHRSASFSIQAVERTLLLGIRKNDLDLLVKEIPDLEKYFRNVYERAYSASLLRIKLLRLPKDEFYALFCTKYPEFIQRIPQKLLASFLGFTPEYLSELRKRNH
jgi:CRP-like cAMP-binding protein